jgi:hypothetical protein
VLKEAGYKTGLYTSPYIVDFRERLRVDGEMISENDLEKVTETVKTEIEKLRSEDIIITEFEAVTAAAFLYYKNVGCDFVVLETGLGGRFYATNVIERPLASVIVSISLEMYMIHVMLYKVVLYYIPDIRTSDDYSMMKNGLLYLGIIAVSFILSLLFKKFTDCIIVKMNKVKKSDS